MIGTVRGACKRISMSTRGRWAPNSSTAVLGSVGGPERRLGGAGAVAVSLAVALPGLVRLSAARECQRPETLDARANMPRMCKSGRGRAA